MGEADAIYEGWVTVTQVSQIKLSVFRVEEDFHMEAGNSGVVEDNITPGGIATEADGSRNFAGLLVLNGAAKGTARFFPFNGDFIHGGALIPGSYREDSGIKDGIS